MRYTQIAYQIIGTIAIGFIAGYFADKWLSPGFPLFELIFSFGAVIIALYLVIKNISKKEG
ncbi:MAG: AtpZ/AtpI family protein [Chitinophagales bacterium]|nr:AtpZ/AtpI family protein [Chitinophagales bacterium]